MYGLACVFILAPTIVLAGNMYTVFEWSVIDYSWPNPQMKYEYIVTGRYNERLVIPMDVDKDINGRVFVTLLGNAGTPANLGIVSNVQGSSGPLIQPYPNWWWFRPGDCATIQNVYRIAIDQCNRLWVLDTGVIDGGTVRCQPKLVVFDLNIDQYITSILFPFDVAYGKNGQSLLANVIVDNEGQNCQKTTVYIADSFGVGLIIVNYYGQSYNFRRLSNPTFQPNPSAANFFSGDSSIVWKTGGILGLAISPRLNPYEKKMLYFRPLSSYDIFTASLESVEHSNHGYDISVKNNKRVLLSQAVSMAFTSQGTLFYGLTKENGIGCWNKYRPLVRENTLLIAQDYERLQYINGLKVIKRSLANPEESLWVLSNRFIQYLSNRWSKYQVNFRILTNSVRNLVDNTICSLQNNIFGVPRRRY